MLDNIDLIVNLKSTNGWMTFFLFFFYLFFKSISVISGRWEVDNERLCAVELRLRLRTFRLEIELGLLDQKASAKPTELSGLLER